MNVKFKILFSLPLLILFQSRVHGQSTHWQIQFDHFRGLVDGLNIHPHPGSEDFDYFVDRDLRNSYHLGFRLGARYRVDPTFAFQGNLMIRGGRFGMGIVVPEHEDPNILNPRPGEWSHRAAKPYLNDISEWALELGLEYRINTNWFDLYPNIGIGLSRNKLFVFSNSSMADGQRIFSYSVAGQNKWALNPYLGFSIERHITKRLIARIGMRGAASFVERYSGIYLAELNSGNYSGTYDTTLSRLEVSVGLGYAL